MNGLPAMSQPQFHRNRSVGFTRRARTRLGARALFVSSCLAAAAPAVMRAQPFAATDTVFAAMSDEMDRTMRRLEMEDLGRPYFMSLTVCDHSGVRIVASLGGLMDRSDWRTREAKIDLRVGGPDFDNSRFGAISPTRATLALDDDYDAIRHGLWWACDNAYKNAQSILARKRAYKQSKLIADNTRDLSADPVETTPAPAPEACFDAHRWEDVARRISAVFRDSPTIQRSSVVVTWSRQRIRFADSEGRRAFKPNDLCHVVIAASTQAADGRPLAEERHLLQPFPFAESDLAAIEAEAAGVARDLAALTEAPLWEDTYIGPVLIEGQAAGEFFNQLLARNVSFPRPIWFESEVLRKDYMFGKFADLLGLRVVAPILSAWDDPSLASFEGRPLAGHYAADDEGIRPARVHLIEKGIATDVLMSRAPIKARARSNGHGRAAWNEFPNGRIGNLFVEADPAESPAKLRKELRRRAADFGLKYGMVLRRMGHEDQRESGELLAQPVMLYKMNVADGSEQLVRNAEFSGVTLRALRDIVMAGNIQRVYNCHQTGPALGSHTAVPASIVHPDILVAEMEFKASEKKPEALPRLARPAF